MTDKLENAYKSIKEVAEILELKDKKTGKPIMFRSNLPAKQVKRKGSNADEIADAAADRELEDFLARQY